MFLMKMSMLHDTLNWSETRATLTARENTVFCDFFPTRKKNQRQNTLEKDKIISEREDLCPCTIFFPI